MSTPTPPERIGPYRIAGVLGEGGMGVVYLAEQSEPVQRTVALKILRPGADSAEVLGRFEAERQALAVMDHPAIAKIFDAGVTEDGRSYFVMERVIGESITEYCDAHEMSVRDRVALFVQVCHAVQHAHQKGVIHRDLKPSNILVSEVGKTAMPRVIDFGIAKATESADFDGTQLTRDDQVIGTPAYMSPEQIEGSSDVDTRSDVYSLGVMLYELLVGALPFNPEAYRGWAAIASQLHRDPPSLDKRLEALEETRDALATARGTSAAGLGRVLSGDLGWIVLQAMEKGRSERYQTAEGLSEDLERFLSHEAVHAMGGATSYRLRKFVRRHRGGVAFASTAVLGLVSFSISTAVQSERVAQARDVAQLRQGQAEGLIGFMLGDLRVKLDGVGRLDILDDVGAEALAYFAAVEEEDLSGEELFRRAQAIQQIGEVRADQGDWDAASDAFQTGLTAYRTLAARSPDNDEWQMGLGAGLFWVGFAHRSVGRGDSALAYFEEYRDVALRNAERAPEDLAWQKELASTLTNVVLQRRSNGDLDGVVEGMSEALRVKERIAEATPDDLTAAYDVSQGHYNLGVALEDAGRVRAAREAFASDVEIKEALIEADSLNAQWRARLLVSNGRLMRAVAALGDTTAALAIGDEMLAQSEAQMTLDPTNESWAREAAVAKSFLGAFNPRRADLLDDGVDVLRRLVAGSPTHNQLPLSLVTALARRSVVRVSKGAPEAGLADAAEAMVVIETYLTRRPGHRSATFNRASASRALGDAQTVLGRHDDAASAWNDGFALLEPFRETRRWSELAIMASLASRLGLSQQARELSSALEAQGLQGVAIR